MKSAAGSRMVETALIIATVTVTAAGVGYVVAELLGQIVQSIANIGVIA